MHLNGLAYLDLSNNKISGDIPNWIWEMWNCYSLNLSHNMLTGMELNSYVFPFSNALHVFDLKSNRLQGQIPMPGSAAFLLDYSNNMFSSLLPNFTIYLSSTQFLKLSNNNISGHLPRSICDSPLEILDLPHNNFSRLLPPCLMENVYLRILSFEGESIRRDACQRFMVGTATRGYPE
ncbi:hypothetical protein BAE44_0011955 [Dichanthelium oligosanthes]|uniref:Uncharacterized protein n=1 Tax=Dichanthelium oligosanthes TaxID=888268 RepID=A0A1E5VPL3_9POAL|nr:hypothetical protein BAE44_0011955 [Dichanthelium oligosanthes]